MKVDSLLAQYLYQHKRLSLPGIGLFTLSDTAILQDESSKTKTPIEGITFIPKTGAQPDDGLITFIKSETGKMKALAQADLDSYIMLAQQFLNIGKPFYIEGVGTLHKHNDGSLEFNSGTSIAVKPVATKTTETTEAKKKSVFAEEENTGEATGGKFRKLAIALGILGTLAVIAGGGYYLYNKNTGATTVPENNIKIVPDSQATSNITPDTTVKKELPPPPVATTTAAGSFKFILETTNSKARAIKRYNLIKESRILKSVDSKIQLETKDSLTFKFYIIIPCKAADTTGYKNSLNEWYYGNTKMKIKIEQ